MDRMNETWGMAQWPQFVRCTQSQPYDYPDSFMNTDPENWTEGHQSAVQRVRRIYECGEITLFTIQDYTQPKQFLEVDEFMLVETETTEEVKPKKYKIYAKFSYMIALWEGVEWNPSIQRLIFDSFWRFGHDEGENNSIVARWAKFGKENTAIPSPKKDYLRYSLIRASNHAKMQVLKGKYPGKQIHKFNKDDEDYEKTWDELRKFTKSDIKYMIERSLPKQKTYNNLFCNNYFEPKIERKWWYYYICHLFAKLDKELESNSFFNNELWEFAQFDQTIINDLCAKEKFDFSCCGQPSKHTVDCFKLWILLKIYLIHHMIEEIGREPWHPDDVASQYIKLDNDDNVSKFEKKLTCMIKIPLQEDEISIDYSELINTSNSGIEEKIEEGFANPDFDQIYFIN